MASSYYKLEIKDRNPSRRTKGVKNYFVESGLIPGVLYYAGEANVNISVDKLSTVSCITIWSTYF